jgi:hypothetical protein
LETLIGLIVAVVVAIAGLAIALVRGAALRAEADRLAAPRHPGAEAVVESTSAEGSRGRSAVVNVR